MAVLFYCMRRDIEAQGGCILPTLVVELGLGVSCLFLLIICDFQCNGLEGGRKPLALGLHGTNTDAVSLDAQSQVLEATPLAGQSPSPHSVESVCDVCFLFAKLGWSLEQQIFNQSKFPLLNPASLFNSRFFA